MERDRFSVTLKRLEKVLIRSIDLNILFALYNNEEIRHAYKSKCNFKSEDQVIILMITDSKKWHSFAVKKFCALLRGVTSKHDGDFYCLHCFHSYSTKDKHRMHCNVCKDHDYYYTEMPNEDNKILKYNHGEKSMKVPFFIYADLEPLLERIDNYYNNP